MFLFIISVYGVYIRCPRVSQTYFRDKGFDIPISTKGETAQKYTWLRTSVKGLNGSHFQIN